jgi:hypothetical protein
MLNPFNMTVYAQAETPVIRLPEDALYRLWWGYAVILEL